ncbi:MAG: hypothetical protein MJ033_00425 [Victivallaceae bacterium]|nr:hypothetical protein [Victivallaceae bacterium]
MCKKFVIAVTLMMAGIASADTVIVRQPGLFEAVGGIVRGAAEVVTGSTTTISYPSVRTCTPGVVCTPSVVVPSPVVVAPAVVPAPVVTTPLVVPVRNGYYYGTYPQYAYPAHYYRWGNPHYGIGVHHYIHYGF